MLPLAIASSLAATFPFWGGSDEISAPSTTQEQKRGDQSIFELSPPCESKHRETVCHPANWSFQVRGAAFIPLKENLRDIYGSGIPTLEFEGSYSLLKDKWTHCDNFLLWGNVGWTSGYGHHTKMN